MTGVMIGKRVRETTTTTGTGTYSLGGAVDGCQTFVAGIGDAIQCFYVCEDGNNWEVGIGTITDASPDTLSRDEILGSSNGGAAVDWGSGTRNIFCDVPPEGVLNLSVLTKTAAFSISRSAFYDNYGTAQTIEGQVDNVPGMHFTVTNLDGTYELRIQPPSGKSIIWSDGTATADKYLAIKNTGGSITAYVNNQGNVVIVSENGNLEIES